MRSRLADEPIDADRVVDEPFRRHPALGVEKNPIAQSLTDPCPALVGIDAGGLTEATGGNVNALYFDKLGAAIIDRPPHELQSMEKAE